MREPTKEELLEFMRKNYGDEWARPEMLDLALTLWRKKFGNKYAISSGEYPKVKISDLERGNNFAVEGIIINVEQSQYQACPVCKKSVRKNCEHIKSKSVRPVMLTRMMFTVSDGTGELVVDGVFQNGSVPQVNIGDLVLVKDYVSRNPMVLKMIFGGIEILKSLSNNGSSVSNSQENNIVESKNDDGSDVFDGFGLEDDSSDEIVMSHGVYKVLGFVRRVGGVATSVLRRMVEREGVDMNEVLKFVVEEDGKYKIKPGLDLDKVKLR